MGIKSFLAGAEAKGRSMIPIERRLKAADARFDQSTARLNRIKSGINAQDKIIGTASNALELSVAGEAAADNRNEHAKTDREFASARSDLRAAEKLSRNNRAVIEKAERKLKALNTDLKATMARQSTRAVESARLHEQLKAQKAAGPSRVERASQRIGAATSKITQDAKRTAKTNRTALRRKPTTAARKNRVAVGNLPFPVKVRPLRVKVGTPGQIAKQIGLGKGDTLEIIPTSVEATAKVTGAPGKSVVTTRFNADVSTKRSISGITKRQLDLQETPKRKRSKSRRSSGLIT